jgi:hypothetical protein
MALELHWDRGRIVRLGFAGALGLFCSVLPAHEGRAAGGAFSVDDSEIGAPGECKVESWGSFASNRDFISAVAPACVVNVGRPVEAALQFARSRSDGHWSTGLVLKGKTSLVPIGNGGIGVALVGGIGFDLTQGQAASTFVSLPVSFQISEPLRFNLNIGAVRDLIEDRTIFTWGAGADFSVTSKVTLIAEVFGADGETGAQTGIRYTPHEKIDFDLIYGRNLTGERADWITFGVNVRF